MAINRPNQFLAALVVVQLAIAAFVFWPRSNAASAAGEPLFPDVQIDQVTVLTVQDANNSVVLAKQDGEWALPEAGDYPVKGEEVISLLEKIVALESGRLVTRTPGSHARLKVAGDDFERRIDFQAGDQEYTLFVGTTVSAQTAHVRVGGQDVVYLAENMSSWQIGTTSTAWINTVYFQVNQNEINALTLENSNGTFEFTKDDDGNWTMAGLVAGETMNANNLTSLVTRLTALNLVRPLGREEEPGYGLESPLASIMVTTVDADGNEVTDTLRIGALDEETNGYVVSSSQSPYFVEVASYSVEDFVTRTRDEFLVAPTPEPAPEPATPDPEATQEPEVPAE